MGEKVRQMGEFSGGKMIDLIASGYNPKVLPHCWLSLVSGVADFPISVEEPVPVPQQFEHDQVLEKTLGVLEDVRRFQKDHWKCLA
jgi:hypothetical protein